MSLLVRRSDTSEFRKRFRWIGLAFVLAAAVIHAVRRPRPVGPVAP